jgi:CheY-like chemotaxis protein
VLERSKRSGFLSTIAREKAMTLRILYAEDVANLRETMEAVLTRRGHTLTAVENGQLLLEKLEAGGEYDVVLTDNDMPVMRGIDALHHLREDARFKDLPVLVFTANKNVRPLIEEDGGIFLDKLGETSELYAALAKFEK